MPVQVLAQAAALPQSAPVPVLAPAPAPATAPVAQIITPAKPPALRAQRAAKPASAGKGNADPQDVPKPDAATCTGPACSPTPAPELKPVAAPVRDKSPKLNAAADKSVKEAQTFANTAQVQPAIGKGGRVIFSYGDAIPTVVCAPLRVCDVELEPGETIQGAPHIGDAVRWRISPAVSFEGDQRVTHLVIKATAADLDTNLIVPTDRRTYYLRLVSSEDKYVSRVAFDYPANDARAWKRVSQPNKPAAGNTASALAQATATDDLPAVALSRLSFDYTVKSSGNPKFKPLRVMDDGARLFITMRDSMSVDEAPVLFVVGADGVEQIVNYRLRGNIYVIDRLADKVALVSGTGSSQQRVDISRGSCVKVGWFSHCPATQQAE